MPAPYRKKLIEVALPLEAINRASGTEKSIRHGHPSTLHLWWARRPLAAARAVLFAQLVDDPSAWPERFPTEDEQVRERQRLFTIIEAMLPWEASLKDDVIYRARLEIAQSWARSHPSDKAGRVLAEDLSIDATGDRRLVDDYLATELPPVHDPFAGGGSIPLEAQRLGLRAIATDLNPVAVLINKALIEIPPRFAGHAPVNPAARGADAGKPTKGRKGTQATIAVASRAWRGAQGLADDVRYFGAWMREQAKARIGHLYPEVKVTPADAAGRPELEPLVGKSATVIAWLWARTVASPDPAFAGIHVPLTSSLWLSTKEGRETWIEPVVDLATKSYRFVIKTGDPGDQAARDRIGEGTKLGRGANFRCVLSGTPISPAYIKAEGMAGRLSARMMAMVADGARRRVYLAPTAEVERTALQARSSWRPEQEMPKNPRWFSPPDFGMPAFADLFTERQLVAATTMSDLVLAARDLAADSARSAGLSADELPLRQGGQGAVAYGDAIALLLAFAVNKSIDGGSSICRWMVQRDSLFSTFSRQAIPMTWDFAEVNPLADCTRSLSESVQWTAEAVAPLAMLPVAVVPVHRLTMRDGAGLPRSDA